MENLHQIVRKCPDCVGTGRWYAPHCSQCGEEVDLEGDWPGKSEGLLPCGHEVSVALVEWVDCETCGGNGRITQTFTPEQWQHRQRRRIVRWVFVSLLLLILVAAVSTAIMREPGYLCGNPWYGLITLALLLKSPFTIHHS